ncbi:hypothetical protein AA0113_g8525 [Alternaria arborescens]|uniref:Uncharacterized protein n=1 Tax=Alternaria arborescens TaxID=156630 RepID=A0A4Q4RJF4_9PLEO|nr:hypothetical protein AA0111_g7229 [Alternaria arborescens]RYN17998.1 hypothetical protein AA0112_g11791 [Alternaria arborescens]RYO27484.1 hypothetical protein AA0111_g7229 [Alternaria arborescens]RYO56890.1 hypothetical protein AA0113_g8525 [Alternaria arborescens]
MVSSAKGLRASSTTLRSLFSPIDYSSTNSLHPTFHLRNYHALDTHELTCKSLRRAFGTDRRVSERYSDHRRLRRQFRETFVWRVKTGLRPDAYGGAIAPVSSLKVPLEKVFGAFGSSRHFRSLRRGTANTKKAT